MLCLTNYFRPDEHKIYLEESTMNKRNTFVYLSAFISVIFICDLQAMEATHVEPIIVDHNEDQSIKMVIEKPALIAVHGGTPRYSYSQDYIQTLKQDYASLSEPYKKNKRLKGVEGSIKKFLEQLSKNPGLPAFESFLDNASDRDKMKLFFAAGLDQKTLKTNFEILVKTAHKELLEKATKTNGNPENLYLTHLLLPSYFKDAVLKNDPEAAEKLHAFLKEAAHFYKDLYKQSATDPLLKICIVIPQLKHFLSAVNQADAADKAEINTDVIQTELIDVVGSDNGFVLLNQEVAALPPIVQELQKRGTPKVAGAGIPIFNSFGQISTKFNPYLLKKGKKHNYQTSPLFNNVLLTFVQNKYAEKKP